MSDNPIKLRRDYFSHFLKNPSYFNVTEEDIKCELQLSSMGNYEKLGWEINSQHFIDEISQFETKWRDYLPRPDRPNNRYGLLLSGLPGNTCESPCSLPEAREAANDNSLQDIDFNVPTDAYTALTSLKPILDYFYPLGRTYILKMHAGSYFPMHKDDPFISRKTFRVAGFIGDVGERHFTWIHDDHRLTLNSGDFAYIDTRKKHCTAMNNIGTGYHIIIDVPKTWENVIKLMGLSSYN